MRYRCRVFVAAVCSIFLCSSCSYIEFEQNLRELGQGTEQSKEEEKDVEGVGNIDTGTDLKQPEWKRIGEEVIVNDGLAVWSYRVEKVTVYDNLESAGLGVSDVTNVSEGYWGNPFVLLDLTVENREVLTEVPEYNIAIFHLMNQEVLEKEDPWAEYFPEIRYFSLHDKNENESEYFHFTIREGEQISCQIGWVLGGVVSTDEKLILHVGADITVPNYVDLESGRK